MGWIIALLVLWLLLPFANAIVSLVAWIVKWIMIGGCIIIEMFKKWEKIVYSQLIIHYFILYMLFREKQRKIVWLNVTKKLHKDVKG